MKIQRVELNQKYYANIHCPFCGALVYEQDKDDGDLDSMLKPCSHTLFFAYDDDLHFRSARFDELKSMFNRLEFCYCFYDLITTHSKMFCDSHRNGDIHRLKFT